MKSNPPLTIQEWSLGNRCPTKILHSRARLPRSDSDGGFAVWMRAESGKLHALARHLFPGAVTVTAKDPVAAAIETRALIAAGKTVHRAHLSTDDLLCNVDFIVPDHKQMTLRIYQVVLRAIDLERHRLGLEFAWPSGKNRKEWHHKLESLALRRHAVQENWPQYRVLPFFVAAVKGRATQVEGLHDCFKPTTDGWMTTNSSATGEATHLLTEVCVSRECVSLTDNVMRQVAELNFWLQKPAERVLDYSCKNCEFRLAEGESGFDRCWGPLARVTPHMYDLTYMYNIKEGGGKESQPVASRLAREGKVSMYDIPLDLITGVHADRQLRQIELTKMGGEIIDEALRDAMERVVFPLHFIDIETVEPCLPVHKGKVGALNIFQLSLHRRKHKGAELEHFEWLNTERSSPNRRFLSTLRSMIGDEGTTLVWSNHEEKCFNSLLASLIGEGEEDESGDLRWLKIYLKSGRILDQCKLCADHHINDRMFGRTSLKVVFPAIWSEPSPVKARAPYSQFPADCDPYSVLKARGQINEGCGAMTAYLEMQASEGVLRSRLIRELLSYCLLDTLAMAYCWDAWEYKLAQHSAANDGILQSSADIG